MAATPAPDLTIGVHRMVAGPHCQTGYLSVNGRVICYTLERAAAGNTPDESSIPAGIYGAHLRYDHPDRWRIELEDVPDRTHIQLHVGNYPTETKGCILVGMEVNPEGCVVSDSAKAYAKLKAAFYGSDHPNASPDVIIRVKVEDVGPASPPAGQ